MAKKAPVGAGERFAALSTALAHRPGVHNPDALAAYIGRQKMGAAHFAAIAARARSRKAHGRHVSRQVHHMVNGGKS